MDLIFALNIILFVVVYHKSNVMCVLCSEFQCSHLKFVQQSKVNKHVFLSLKK